MPEGSRSVLRASRDARDAVATCEPRAVHVGAAYNGKKYQKIGNSCYEADYPGQVFYEGVDDIDQTTFEELTAVIE